MISSDDVVNGDALLKEANALINLMNARQVELDQNITDSALVLQSANETMEEVREYNVLRLNLTARFDGISAALDDIVARLSDLLSNANDALQKSKDSENLLNDVQVMLEKLQEDTKTIKAKKEQIVETLAEAATHTELAANNIEMTNVTYMVRQLTTDWCQCSSG